MVLGSQFVFLILHIGTAWVLCFGNYFFLQSYQRLNVMVLKGNGILKFIQKSSCEDLALSFFFRNRNLEIE